MNFGWRVKRRLNHFLDTCGVPRGVGAWHGIAGGVGVTTLLAVSYGSSRLTQTKQKWAIHDLQARLAAEETTSSPVPLSAEEQTTVLRQLYPKATATLAEDIRFTGLQAALDHCYTVAGVNYVQDCKAISRELLAAMSN
jgi:hypothetical protein